MQLKTMKGLALDDILAEVHVYVHRGKLQENLNTAVRLVSLLATLTALIESFSKEDADTKDDVKMAWCAHSWMCHAIFKSSLMSRCVC